MTTPAKLEVRGLSKCFWGQKGRTVSVVEGLDLAVADREFLAVIGPSGCGKSTILRMIDGLLPPDKGEIRIEGKLVVGPGGSRGMVFQNGDLFPWRTALQNVEFGLQMLGVSRDKRRAIALQHLTLVGLTGFEDAYPYQLSGGMQQRVGIARALAIDPAVPSDGRAIWSAGRPDAGAFAGRVIADMADASEDSSFRDAQY